MSLALEKIYRRSVTLTETIEEACVLCGSHEARRLFTARDRLHGLPGDFWVVRCVACKLLRTSPRPSGEALAMYYPEGYAPHRDAGGEASTAGPASPRHSAWTWLRQRVMSRRIWWTPDLPPAARVLELGSGGGHFARYAIERGWEVHALEPAARPAEQLSRNPRVRIQRDPAESMNFPPASLDAVFAWMAVEHLEDPSAVFRKISAALTPGGYFVFSVPNAGSWEFVLFRERWYGLDVPRHLWHFSPRTLRRLLAVCGLTVDHVFHQKVLKNISGSLSFLGADRPRLEPLTRSLARGISSPLVSFALGSVFAALRQGGRLTVVARKAGSGSA